MVNPITPYIQILLLQFKDGLRHIDESLAQGTVSADEAHNLKNALAAIYADAVANVIEERRRTNGRD